jgi:hypothetical protein
MDSHPLKAPHPCPHRNGHHQHSCGPTAHAKKHTKQHIGDAQHTGQFNIPQGWPAWHRRWPAYKPTTNDTAAHIYVGELAPFCVTSKCPILCEPTTAMRSWSSCCLLTTMAALNWSTRNKSTAPSFSYFARHSSVVSLRPDVDGCSC